MSVKKKTILLVGGGTLGSVSPLLAIAESYQAEYLFVGTKYGPEKAVIEKFGLNFQAISSGKLRRYFSWHNFVDIFKINSAFWQGLKIIKNFQPDLILTAGSFVAVPVVYAAKFKKVPVIVHQQDLSVGLANKLMAPLAKKITLTFEEQKKYFKTTKVIVTGNPVRKFLPKVSKAGILNIVITGGGLGARGFNDFLSQFIPDLSKTCFVHHILGKANFAQALDLKKNYQAYQFIDKGMIDLLAQADIIISRAGMSLITEAAMLKKALVLIPMPQSHQEKNAAFFAKNNAAFYCRQGANKILARYLEKLFKQEHLRQDLGNNLSQLFPKNAVDNYIKVIEDII